MWHTSRSCLMIWCVNMKWIWLVLLNIQSKHNSIHRQTAGHTYWWTDKPTDRQRETSIPPFNSVEVRGIIIDHTERQHLHGVLFQSTMGRILYFISVLTKRWQRWLQTFLIDDRGGSVYLNNRSGVGCHAIAISYAILNNVMWSQM